MRSLMRVLPYDRYLPLNDEPRHTGAPLVGCESEFGWQFAKVDRDDIVVRVYVLLLSDSFDEFFAIVPDEHTRGKDLETDIEWCNLGPDFAESG